MLSFLLDEGVITIGVLSGLFTTGLLNSLKTNIIDPSIEKIVPSHKLDIKVLPPVTQSPVTQSKSNLSDNDKSNFANIFPIPIGTPEHPQDNIIRWQTFLKDFITWLIIMFIFYLFWKYVLVPRKLNKNI